MKRPFKASGWLLALALTGATPLASAAAQGTLGGAPIPGAPAPGAVNLTGKWINATPMVGLKTLDGKAPPLTAKGRAAYAKNRANLQNDPVKALCQLHGTPRILYTAYPFLIVQHQTHVDFIYEVNHIFRFVHFDTRPDPETVPAWLGLGFGSWDGQTMVIDNFNFNDKTWLDYQGLPHGDKLKTQERYTLSADGQTINGTVRIEDPDYFSRAWTTAFTLRKQPGFSVRESVCEEDHRM